MYSFSRATRLTVRPNAPFHMVPALSNAEADEILAGATTLTSLRQSADDRRACIRFIREGNVFPYDSTGASGPRPNVVFTEDDYDHLLENVRATVRVVSAIAYPQRAWGMAEVGVPGSIVVVRDMAGWAPPFIWAHELWHTAGLEGRTVDTPTAIINEGEEPRPTGNELNEYEAAAYYAAAP